MLTQLLTVKTRLGLDPFEVKNDSLLTNAIRAVSARFELECQRSFARAASATEEFPADTTEIRLPCYPLEQITRFELKRDESEGWVAASSVECLVRRQCVISLRAPLGAGDEMGRVVYAGGYVLPGSEVGAGQIPLPAELEQAAVEQVVYWYQNRDRLGVIRQWPKGGTYEQFADLDLLPGVRAVLERYERAGG